MSSGGMSIDIRIPIGLLFLILGVVISGYGVLADKAIYAKSLGININLYSGVGMAIFGVFMLLSAWIGGSKKNAAPSADATAEKK